MNIKRISIFAGFLFLAGCKVGPDFQRPEVKVPSTYSTTRPTTQATTQSTTRPSNEAIDLSAVQWWKSFGDPVLDSLIERATKSNLTLQQAEARVRAVRARLGIAKAGLWPSVDASGSVTRSRIPSNVNDGGTTSNNYHAGFDAAWELDIFGGTRRSIEAANADLNSSVEDYRDVMVSLLGEVASTYTDLRVQQDRIAIAGRNLKSQERTADVIRKQVEGGFGTALDLANAEVATATTRSQIPVFETLLEQDIHALSVLLGLAPTELKSELENSPNRLSFAVDVPPGLPSDLLRRRPDIRRVEADLHSATAHIGVAVADLFPRVSLTGEIGISANRFSGLGHWSNRTWSAGPGVTWNIFSGGQIQNNIKVQEALRDEQTLVYRQTVLNALREVEDALVAIDREQARVIFLDDAVKASRRAVDVAEKLYANGQVDFLNVTTAQKLLLQTEDSQAQSRRALITNTIALYKALGGGWNTDPARSEQTQPTTMQK